MRDTDNVAALSQGTGGLRGGVGIIVPFSSLSFCIDWILSNFTNTFF